MAEPPRWKLIETEHLQDCAVFQVLRTRVRSPHSGDVHAFYRIDADDWVNVVPVTEAGEVVLVRQFRHGSQQVTLEIPGGIIDPGESPGEAGRREVLEETGYRCEALEPIGVVNPNPALFSNRVHSFLARGALRVAEPRNEGSEHTVVELVPRDEIAGLLRSGRIDHALVVAALQAWLLADAPQPFSRARSSG